LRAHSNIESNDLSGRHLQFLVNASLQVLVEKSLKLFILLIQQTRLLNQILTIDEQLVVLAEGFVEGLPDGEFLVGEDLGHLCPVHLLLLLLAAGIARLIRRLRVLRLLLVLLVHQVFAQVAVVASLVELLQSSCQQLSLKSELVLVDLFLLATGHLALAVKRGLIAGLLGIVGGVWHAVGLESTRLHLFLLFFLHALFLLLQLLLMLLLILVQHVHQQLHICHVLNAETFTDGVDLDLELLFRGSFTASLHGFIIDQEWRLIDQKAEDLLHTLILFTSSVLILGAYALIIDELTLGLSLSVIATL